MFNNIGEKCKRIAKIDCYMGIALFVIVGIVYIVSGKILDGIIIAIVGSAVAYISSIGLYALGEAAENSDIAANLAAKADFEKEQQKQSA